MLSKNTVLSAYSLADNLANKSLAVYAKPNTVISELNRVTNSIVTNSYVNKVINIDAFNIDEFSSVLCSATTSSDTPTLHDVSLDNFSKDLKLAVLSHVQFAKNIVKPIVVEYAQRIENHIKSLNLEKAEDCFKIEVVEIPEILEDDVFLDSLSYYENKPVIAPTTPLVIEHFTKEEFLEFIYTGSTGIDKAITAWASREGIETLTDRINSLLTQDIPSCTDVFTNLNTGLLIYLTTNALYNKTNKGKDANLTAFKNSVAEYRDYAGALMCKSLVMIRIYEKSEMVILSTDIRSYSARVFGKVFRKWLESNSIELIFGVIIKNDLARTIKHLTDVSESLLREWNSYKLFFNSKQTNNRIDVLKSSCILIFREIMSSLNPEETQYVNTHADYYSNVNKKLEMIVSKLKLSDFNNIYNIALMIVCRCRFYYTDAEFILSEIEEICAQNPTIDVREAALLSTINYLVDYLCDQLFVTSKI